MQIVQFVVCPLFLHQSDATEVCGVALAKTLEQSTKLSYKFK